jgi:hypothetical protein
VFDVNLSRGMDSGANVIHVSERITAGLGIDVRPSTLAGAGMGLFAFKNFPKGAQVASYSGSLVPAAEAKDNQYAVAWRRGQVVDASSTQHSVGRYANTCRSADKRRDSQNISKSSIASESVCMHCKA